MEITLRRRPERRAGILGLDAMCAASIVDDPRPWAFNLPELTAGLRRHTGDPSLRITRLEEHDLPYLRPAVGRIRGLDVACQGRTGDYRFPLVLKEAKQQGNTRAGTTSAGQREAAFYLNLTEVIPVRIPKMYASDASGNWLVLEMLDAGRTAEQWRAADYELATAQLTVLHDRFWGLGADLAVYPWLGRPLQADFDIHVKVAAAGIQRLTDDPDSELLAHDPGLVQLLSRLTLYAARIAAALRQAPATLLHGDYWPGNIHVDQKGRLTVYDWQQASIGPGVLDLLDFVQASRWWFDPLPISAEEIVARYREGIHQAVGKLWTDSEWTSLWEHALMWTFLFKWVDILASTPWPVLSTRYQQLADLWLGPVRASADRYLPEA
jgi:hypothetical protein